MTKGIKAGTYGDVVLVFRNFDQVELSRNFISEVYFAASVPEKQRDQIKTAIMTNPAASPQAAATLPDPSFYQYIANRRAIKARLPMDFLYDKYSPSQSTKFLL